MPDVKPKIKEKGTLNLLISKKYFQIALLYILCNKFRFGHGIHILPNVCLASYFKLLRDSSQAR